MDIKAVISNMTLDEKVGLCSGADYWWTKGVPRLDVKPFMMSDGPYGLRKQAGQDSVNESIKAVCFPTGSAVASSFDRDLIRQMGISLGGVARHENVGLLLGPAINIKRSPVCGRNFEYLSEDPMLAGELACAYIDGVQSKGVGTCVKHFLANNQEYRRMTSSSNVDERTLREIYLPAFEMAVKQSNPSSFMCSYNRVNGEYASESERFLTKILRDEWGFDGFVVSDWGAVNDRVKALKAGLDIDMPHANNVNDDRIRVALDNGELDEAVLDKTVERVLRFTDFYHASEDVTDFDLEKQHDLAVELAENSAVLLKNKNGLLPLNKNEKIAFIGAFAKMPRFQGGGSSHINAYKPTNALESSKKYADIIWAMGYDLEEKNEILDEAVELAKKSDVAVVFAGLPDVYECEGYDREHMRLPENQTRLILEVAKVAKKTVVVLHNGSPVEMPWLDEVDGVLDMYLGGEGVGEATAKLIFGEVSPSGKLAETFPIRFEDNPSYIYYLGEGDEVEYREGIFVGYRYYDKKKMPVLFPFGYGLSYTKFSYTNMKMSADALTDDRQIEISVDVENTGEMNGAEVVQLYVRAPESKTIRPVRELKGFEKVFLKKGEKKTLNFRLLKRDFSYYNTDISDFYAPSGSYIVEIAKSSREIVLSSNLDVISPAIKKVYTINSTLGDVMSDPKASELMTPFLEKAKKMMISEDSESGKEAITDKMIYYMMQNMPLRGVFSFADTGLRHEDLEGLVAMLNAM